MAIQVLAGAGRVIMRWLVSKEVTQVMVSGNTGADRCLESPHVMVGEYGGQRGAGGC